MLQGIVQQTGMNEAEIRQYIASMGDEELAELYGRLVDEEISRQYAQNKALNERKGFHAYLRKTYLPKCHITIRGKKQYNFGK
jgi:hypothetical protein